MSKESLDYSILCPNYYTNWEEGCCMENCTHNNLDLCPIHYVKGLLEDKDQQIAELEAKLAESEKKIEELKGERLTFYTDDVRRTQVINGVHFDIEQLLVFSEYVEHENWVKAEYEKEIDKLKQQLAEKDKQIDERMMVFEKRCQEYYKSKEFTIEQLEKVKEFYTTPIYDRENSHTEVRVLLQRIDNQIKQLKEGK